MNLLYLPISQFAVDLDPCQKGNDFFGLLPWYHYLPSGSLDSSCNVKEFNILPGTNTPSDVPLVFIAVIDDLLRIAALVAIGFVIVGAIRLITSQGNPEDTSKAQSTIINALVGVAIAIISAGIVNFLGNKLGG